MRQKKTVAAPSSDLSAIGGGLGLFGFNDDDPLRSVLFEFELCKLNTCPPVGNPTRLCSLSGPSCPVTKNPKPKSSGIWWQHMVTARWLARSKCV